MAEKKTTFVLIHGAWGGGWNYQRVAEALRARGHVVYAPSLTGCGERAHLLNGTVNLSTHIQDVVNLFKYESIERAVLVGHSYGGMVITGAADRIPEKISALVYLDAFLPENNQSLWDINIAANTARYLASAGDAGGYAIPSPPASFWNLNANDVPLYEKLTGPHPLAALTERLRLSGGHASIKKCIYVHATDLGRPSPFLPFYEKCKANPAWETYALACGHDVMMDMPEKTLEILLSAI